MKSSIRLPGGSHQLESLRSQAATNMLRLGCVVVAVLLSAAVGRGGEVGQPHVSTMRVPGGGIQPQTVVEDDGTLHMIYFTGDARAGDVRYVRSTDEGQSWTQPLRVNSQASSSVAVGNIRGAHLAVGRGGRAYVAWNGSGKARPKGPDGAHPMLFARLNDQGDRFEPQRNVIQRRTGLDGGGSVAADGEGNVYVTWHAPGGQGHGEGGRRVWITHSNDDGRTFTTETAATDAPTGACGCCGMRAFADRTGGVHLLYRGAAEVVNRDMFLLTSLDRGRTFSAAKVDEWKIGQCMMSSAALADGPTGVLAAWETKGQVYFGASSKLKSESFQAVAATGNGSKKKHPAVAANGRGEIILAWTEGMGWNRGGTVAWQVYDNTGRPIAGGRADGVPVWSLVAVFARSDGGFTVVY